MKDTIFDSKGKLVGWLLVFIILAVVPTFTASYWVTLITQMFIFGILAMSLDLMMGYSGMPSFGHAGFFGVAAYVIAIFSTRYQIGFWPSLVTAIVLATVVSAIFGLLVAHSKGVYFLMITLALGMVLWGLAFRWVTMTKGDNGISGILRPDIGLPISLKDPITFYYVTLVVFIICLGLMALFVRSPFGHSMKGIRESESRMRTVTDTARDAIVMMNTKGLISYWNPAASRLFSYMDTEALGQDLHAFTELVNENETPPLRI